jgi:hypothetical protein
MEAHRASDRIEKAIRYIDKSKFWVINVHLDPYDDFEENDKEVRDIFSLGYCNYSALFPAK